MGAIGHLIRRELGAYFNTPIGYVFMVFFLVVTCWSYVATLFLQGVAEMRDYFALLPLFFLFFAPAVSMRLWAEERKLGTLELLLSFPVRSWQVVLGKFLASLAFLTLTLVLTLHLPLALWLLAPERGAGVDWGPVAGGYLGALVLGMIYLAVGSFASSLTSDQIVAFVAGFSLNFVLFLLGYQPVLDWIRELHPQLASRCEQFGISHHFQSIARGVVDTRDVVYALTVCGLFLFLNVLSIERRR